MGETCPGRPRQFALVAGGKVRFTHPVYACVFRIVWHFHFTYLDLANQLNY